LVATVGAIKSLQIPMAPCVIDLGMTGSDACDD
jgi:hypothetical protein